MVDVTAERSVKRLFRKYGVPTIRRGRSSFATLASIRGPYSENDMLTIRKTRQILPPPWHDPCRERNRVSSRSILTGRDRREDAEAYRSKLEADIRHEILHGRGGRTHTLTIADAGLSYIARPGGVCSHDLWRLDEINRVVGDRSIAQAADAWNEFKRARCGGLSPATVQRFKATFAGLR